jgi:peroxiredoxin
MSRRSTLILVVFVILVVIAGFAVRSNQRSAEPVPGGTEVGQLAPDFTLPLVGGGEVKLSDLRGKVVLVNFWATSCSTCVAEMPKMADAWRRYAPRGYEMVAVAMSYDHPNAVAAFARQRALPFRVALDIDGAVARAFGNVSVTPTTYLLDRTGRIVATYVGEPDWQEFHARIERALAEPA